LSVWHLFSPCRVLLLGLAVAPGFFLLILLVMAPLLWLAFRPSS
jgi:hypothetical protein